MYQTKINIVITVLLCGLVSSSLEHHGSEHGSQNGNRQSARTCDFIFSSSTESDEILEQEEVIITTDIYCSILLNRGSISYEINDKEIASGGKIYEFNSTHISIVNETLYYMQSHCNVTGNNFGRTTLQVVVFDTVQGNTIIATATVDIVVKRKGTILTTIFIVILGVMIVVYNFGFGCKVQHTRIWKILKKPVAPIIGMCLQFLIMAPLSFGISRLLQMDNISGLGLLAIGSSPGGGGSNVFAFLLDGDLELSITMSFLSTLISLGMTPFWIWALGRFYSDGNSRLSIPVTSVFSSLAVVTIPVFFGILLKRFKPKWAAKCALCLKPFTGIIAVVFLGMGIYVYWYALIRVTVQTLGGCLLVSFLGYTLGAVAGKIGRQSLAKIKTISLEVGFQNLALALLILSTALDPPESDIAGVVPMTYSFISAAWPALVFICMKVAHLHRKLHGKSVDMETETSFTNLDENSDTNDTEPIKTVSAYVMSSQNTRL